MIELKFKGNPVNISTTQVAKIINTNSDSSGTTIEAKFSTYDGDEGIFTTSNIKPVKSPSIYGISNLDNILKDDIVVVYPNGLVQNVFRKKSTDNTLFFTNNCNQRCIMCSQPPTKKSDLKLQIEINKRIIEFIPPETKNLGLSGGEPTLYGSTFIELLSQLTSKLNRCEISVLTNSVLLNNEVLFDQLKNIDNKEKIVLCIPLYSDYYKTHDFIVNKESSFYKTINSIHLLMRYGFRIELRLIPQKNNIDRQFELSRFIYRNLTGVEHIAYMSLEMIGNAIKNFNDVFISPIKIGQEIEKPIEFLHNSGMNVSLYNFQHCLIPSTLWDFSRKSISDWKVEYFKKCDNCSLKEECGGIFFSSKRYIEQYINPITLV